MRTLLGLSLCALLGVGTGTALRFSPWAPGRAAAAPAQPRPYVPARTRPLSGTLPPALTRELLGDTGDSAVVAAVRARDCLTCEDLGRQLRQLKTAVGAGVRVLIAVPPGDSARVREFMRTERIRDVELTVHAAPLTLDDGSRVPTPAAFVLGRDGRVRRGIAHLEREKNVRTVSFAQELGYLPRELVPPQVDSSPERKGP